MAINNTQFVVISKWGKRSRFRPFKGVLCTRLLRVRAHPMEKIWEYLHRLGYHGAMKQSYQRAEDRLRRNKRTVIYGDK